MIEFVYTQSTRIGLDHWQRLLSRSRNLSEIKNGCSIKYIIPHYGFSLEIFHKNMSDWLMSWRKKRPHLDTSHSLWWDHECDSGKQENCSYLLVFFLENSQFYIKFATCGAEKLSYEYLRKWLLTTNCYTTNSLLSFTSAIGSQKTCWDAVHNVNPNKIQIFVHLNS